MQFVLLYCFFTNGLLGWLLKKTYISARLCYSKGLYPSSRNCSAITW